jgi:transcriptional regulator with XRE-family HTH domain
MTEKKTQKRFVDHGCGFPVVLQNVPMIHVRGVWTPDIDYNELHRAVLVALAHKPTRLTGNQIKFVRHFFGLTLTEFGNYFDVSHPAVLKWENAGDDVPSIKWSLERDLRLFILDRLEETPDSLGELYKELRSRATLPKSNKLELAKFGTDSAASAW